MFTLRFDMRVPDWAGRSDPHCADVHCTLTLGESEGHGAGRAAMTATAMRVVSAPAGLLSSLDLPMTLPRNVFGG